MYVYGVLLDAFCKCGWSLTIWYLCSPNIPQVDACEFNRRNLWHFLVTPSAVAATKLTLHPRKCIFVHFLLSDIASGRTCVHTQGATFSQIQKSISEYCVLVFEQARARDSYHDELYFLSYSNLCNRINAEVMATAMKAVTALFLIFFFFNSFHFKYVVYNKSWFLRCTEK